MPYKTIIVPTDFSRFANHALRYAKAFAKRFEGKIHFVHVVDEFLISGAGVGAPYTTASSLDEIVARVKAHAESELQRLVQRVQPSGVEAEFHIASGKPALEIVRLATEVDADMIVMATHGHSGLEHALLGSCCEQIIRKTEIPVLALKQPGHEFIDEDDTTIHLNSVLCPCDFSEFSRLAIRPAADLCKEFGATLHLVHAVEHLYDYAEFAPAIIEDDWPTVYEAAQDSLNDAASAAGDVKVTAQVLRGSPHKEIRTYAEDANIDLVVMATHGRSGLSHALLGSVAERLIRTLDRPMLIIRPQRDTERTGGVTEEAAKSSSA